MGRYDIDHPLEQLAPSPWDNSMEFRVPKEVLEKPPEAASEAPPPTRAVAAPEKTRAMAPPEKTPPEKTPPEKTPPEETRAMAPPEKTQAMDPPERTRAMDPPPRGADALPKTQAMSSPLPEGLPPTEAMQTPAGPPSPPQGRSRRPETVANRPTPGGEPRRPPRTRPEPQPNRPPESRPEPPAERRPRQGPRGRPTQPSRPQPIDDAAPGRSPSVSAPIRAGRGSPALPAVTNDQATRTQLAPKIETPGIEDQPARADAGPPFGKSRKKRPTRRETPMPDARPQSEPGMPAAERARRYAADWRNSPHAKKKPHTFLRGMAILSMLVLFEAFAIPGIDSAGGLIAPWKQLDGSTTTLLSGIFFGSFLLAAAIPMPYVVRSGLFVGLGATLLVFGVLKMQAAIDAFAFRGHPGLAFVFAKPGVLTLMVLSLLFPAALFWRSRYTASFGSRIATLLGILLVVLVYLLAGAVGGGAGSPPIAALFGAAGQSGLYLADRLSVFLLLVPVALVPLSALVFLKHPRSGLAGLWAWLYVTALAAVPLMQAGFVSTYRQGQWKFTLAPLEVALFLYAGLLVAPVALGHFIGEIERLVLLAKARKKDTARA